MFPSLLNHFPKYLICGDDMCQHDPIFNNWRILNLSVACVEITFLNGITNPRL